jgi:hypothetical protein
MYVNGTLYGSSGNVFASSTLDAVREPNFIGMGESATENRVSNALLDEIRLYNKALTPEQVVLDMNAVNEIASGIC